MDVIEHRHSGELCTTQHGNPIIHDGHLCEGANLTLVSGENFCLWHRCGSADVPADTAYEGSIEEVTCPDCLAVWNKEKQHNILMNAQQDKLTSEHV